MDSHSCAVMVDAVPADSAVSVVGTGVSLGARPDAMMRRYDSTLVLWVGECASCVKHQVCRVVNTSSRDRQ